jgi:hypothetical protein
MRKLLLATWAIWVGMASDGLAQSRCRVTDPTGTPLNLRAAPNGPIVGALPNGLLVSIVDQQTEANGKAWAFITRFDDHLPLGWVFREFLSCF